jgi:hypothetical protein
MTSHEAYSLPSFAQDQTSGSGVTESVHHLLSVAEAGGEFGDDAARIVYVPIVGIVVQVVVVAAPGVTWVGIAAATRLRAPCTPYSCRNAIIGSVRAALRAGIQALSPATIASTATVKASAVGSAGVSP